LKLWVVENKWTQDLSSVVGFPQRLLPAKAAGDHFANTKDDRLSRTPKTLRISLGAYNKQIKGTPADALTDSRDREASGPVPRHLGSGKFGL
jgi:hypothetical protein